ncbi:Vegetative incompatibility protein HET-E-1 [Colletotrichum viniferum]|nr:Vegetative incompatibility protein HET-E-1 [Colletotrichum viniferum]
MWLINMQTLELEEFVGGGTLNYAILSHTWSCGKVTFQDWTDRSLASQKQGYPKILDACAQARGAEYNFVWVDTNCIDKSSSSELTEAINSMFSWYFHSGVRFAYLSDVPTSGQKFDAEGISCSRWLIRGRTLQSFRLIKRFCSTQPIGRSLAQGHLLHITFLRLQTSTSNISIQSQSRLRCCKIDFHGWLAAKLPDLRIWHIACLEFSAYLCL